MTEGSEGNGWDEVTTLGSSSWQGWTSSLAVNDGPEGPPPTFESECTAATWLTLTTHTAAVHRRGAR